MPRLHPFLVHMQPRPLLRRLLHISDHRIDTCLLLLGELVPKALSLS
jgi:hypothetical protein